MLPNALMFDGMGLKTGKAIFAAFQIFLETLEKIASLTVASMSGELVVHILALVHIIYFS